MLAKQFRRVKTAEITCFNVGNGNFGCMAQGRQTHFIFGLPALDQPQSFAQYLTGVLVAPGGKQLLDKAGLMVGKDNVSGWHGSLLSQVFILAYDAMKSLWIPACAGMTETSMFRTPPSRHRDIRFASANAIVATYADDRRLSYGMCNPSCKRLTICKLSRRLRFNTSETRPLDPM